MKIIYIANARFPNERAHGIQIAKTCESLVQAGANLELVVPRKRNTGEDAFAYYGLKSKFPIKKIGTFEITPYTSFGFLISSFLFGVATFFHLLFQKKEGIIYSIDLDPLSFLGFVFFRTPYFFEMHGPKKNTFLNRFLFKNINGVIAVSESIKNDLIKNFPHLKDKIIICPNGLDLEENYTKAEARKKLGMDLGKKAVVYTGSFQDWKGIETILEAAKKLSDIEFYFVGGEKKGDFSKNIHFMGMRNFKEMPLWRAGADVLIVTGTKKDDYSYYYTSPMKLFEYMGAKKPIVASRTPAIEQVVSDKEVFFHEPDNAQGLADKIEYIFKNPEEAGKKSESAYVKAGEYSWDKRTKKILGFINDKLIK